MLSRHTHCPKIGVSGEICTHIDLLKRQAYWLLYDGHMVGEEGSVPSGTNDLLATRFISPRPVLPFLPSRWLHLQQLQRAYETRAYLLRPHRVKMAGAERFELSNLGLESSGLRN
jgi:hypothetical protein